MIYDNKSVFGWGTLVCRENVLNSAMVAAVSECTYMYM